MSAVVTLGQEIRCPKTSSADCTGQGVPQSPNRDRAQRTFVGYLFAIVAVLGMLNRSVQAESVTNDILTAVVKVHAEAPAEARTAQFLGTNREGSGVVIDTDGLILTIGYLIIEATTVEVSGADGEVVKATIVGQDYDTGFGLVRTTKPLAVKPIPLGQSSEVNERERVLVVSEGRPDAVHPAFVTSRREFAGYWEYLLEDAIFTAPPYPHFAGAALIGSKGQLLGIGSLFVNDALSDERALPGNMFVPIDRLKPILSELITKGHSSAPPRPWLGVFTEEYREHLLVTAVAPDGPADQAGLKPGDLIVGVSGKAVKGQASFYRSVWAQGNAGVEVILNILKELEIRNVTIRSSDRNQYFRTRPARSASGGAGWLLSEQATFACNTCPMINRRAESTKPDEPGSKTVGKLSAR